ncbi:class I SAM-dependent methyltransferase [Brachyspira aalborgi]|uniref:Class I SAM-dependent methyltransferase n=1 Tax=Brachyspira aalborgi TaxID=29522 RepID=A0A5C8DBC6_9SPIR|nr:class I SAM-dependent methyltransferase [Brachyspira aalborgi]TXJ21701.1 class I SAM-dependent methyltransferase [Brachyspira aalborgi]
MIIDKPEKFENEVLNQINDILDIKITKSKLTSEMTYLERYFLNGIVRQTKPKKILELGVSAGGSSAIILNAIKDFDNAKLYSVDYNTKLYYDNSKNTGFIIDEKFSNLKNKWKLYTGGTAAKYMEEIGGEINLCLIDTMHINPGEFLDFLIVLPYLKKNAILILHDIALHYNGNERHSITNCILFSCLRGKKLSFNEGLWNRFANIGAVILDENIKDNILDYLYLLTLPWEYLPTDNDILECQKLFSKHYKQDLVDKFINIMLVNKKFFINDKNLIESRNDKLDRLNKLIDTLAWWIPVRKWRDNFRNKFKI